MRPGQLRHIFTCPVTRWTSPCTVNRTASCIAGLKEQRHPGCYNVRQFHMSQRLGASGDDSTIDFAYLPSAALEVDEDDSLRVPILPNNYDTTENAPADIPATVMKPEISTMSADAVFLPMADMSDGHAMNIDFHAMADRVAANLKNVKNVAPDAQASLIKQIWNDLVDDMIGARKKSS